MKFQDFTQGTTFTTGKDLETGEGGHYKYIVVDRNEKDQHFILLNLTTDHQCNFFYKDWYLILLNLIRV